MSDGVKDEKGAYRKIIATPKTQSPEVSIDDTLRDCLIVIRRIVDALLGETARTGVPGRDVVQSAKDCALLLLELKKKEKEILEGMSETELLKLIKAKK